MASKSADKRYAAMKAVSLSVVTEHGAWILSDRTEIAKRIRELSSLGRTERWTNAVEVWAQEVEDTDNPLDWAFFQYGVYTGHAAE